MVLNAREELFQLIEKLPESKVEMILEYAKQENAEFNYQIQDEDISIILKEDADLLKKLAQ